MYEHGDNTDLKFQREHALETNTQNIESASVLDEEVASTMNNHRFTSYNLPQNPMFFAPPAHQIGNMGPNNEESVVINSERESLRIIEVSQELPSIVHQSSKIPQQLMPGAPAIV